ncbi:MAG: FAD:protein FMN transferase [bacterium]|nr:FAD:protein FMN transferase [bacterium]
MGWGCRRNFGFWILDFGLKISLFTFYFLLFSFITGCGKPKQFFSKTQILMGTIVEIKIINEDPILAEETIKRCFERIKEIEDKMSVHNPESELSVLNRSAGKGMRVSKDLFYVIEKSLAYAKLSDGGFDVTIGPLIELWGFAEDKRRVPSRVQIAQKAVLVDYQQVKLNPRNREVFLPIEGMKIDLGGVAKGYAVEEAMEIIKAAGIKDALVDIGRNIKVIGKNQYNKLWMIGLAHPRKVGEILSAFPLKGDMSVATSGDYEHFFIEDGRRYHHLLDPKSGYPTNLCVSVTIITPSAMIADILSTAVFVLGEVAGMELIEKLDTVEGVIVTDSGIRVSSGLVNKIKFKG